MLVRVLNGKYSGRIGTLVSNAYGEFIAIQTANNGQPKVYVYIDATYEIVR